MQGFASLALRSMIGCEGVRNGFNAVRPVRKRRGALVLLVGWITGLVFFLIDKRPYVRFHAAQAMVVFGGLHILRITLAMVFGLGWMYGGGIRWTSFSFGWLLFSLIGLVGLILWIVLMVKAYQGERFKVPTP